MNIYCIKDRLLDYYMQPFIGPEDKAVMAAVAETINQPGATGAISQTPHHFEIWCLGNIHEDGNVAAGKTLICDCSSLVRPSIRSHDGGEPRKETRQRAPDGRQGPTGPPPGVTPAEAGAPPATPQGAPGANDQIRPGPGGVPGHGTDGVTA